MSQKKINMALTTLVEALGARVFVDTNLEECLIEQVFAGDRMSDLLGAVSERMLIITHLANQGMIRLVELMDASAICLLNGAPPCEALLEVAKETNTPLIVSPFGMYETCGIIYELFQGGGGSVP
ncbi:MAG: hypothetical protein GX130_11060 [Candidatus Hydrogenedens sp.]|nr:hypothetical protein [Candidatus Hydrogenedens sp.]